MGDRAGGHGYDQVVRFPSFISFTVTNTCNLRCQMCGQWSEEGYMHERRDLLRNRMSIEHWRRVIDEIADHGVDSVLVRGGEPFLYPQIMQLLEHLERRSFTISIDTNGTMLSRYAADLVRFSRLHLTISVDGPETVHDEVRAVPGTYQKIKEGVARLAEAERDGPHTVSRSLNFTISPYSYQGLGELPAAARDLGIDTVCIVPYYYLPSEVGHRYQRELAELGCTGYSWNGFHHEDSGVDVERFLEQYRRFRADLGDLRVFDYLPLSEDEYRVWFADAVAPVGPQACNSVERLLDVQPNGDANFCVDFPDYVIGNVTEATVEEIWNGERANRFREARRRGPLGACLRCGAKYMAELV